MESVNQPSGIPCLLWFSEHAGKYSKPLCSRDTRFGKVLSDGSANTRRRRTYRCDLSASGTKGTEAMRAKGRPPHTCRFGAHGLENDWKTRVYPLESVWKAFWKARGKDAESVTQKASRTPQCFYRHTGHAPRIPVRPARIPSHGSTSLASPDASAGDAAADAGAAACYLGEGIRVHIYCARQWIRRQR